MTLTANRNRLEKIGGELLGGRVKKIEPISGGRNSRLCKLIADDGKHYALKQYYGKTIEGRDRLKIETGGLRFLWGHGERAVPKLIAADNDEQVALFDFIDGEPVTDPDNRDIDQLADFLTRLERLSEHPDSHVLPNASEACFSPSEIIKRINKRLVRFDAVASGSEQQQALHDFLEKRFLPALHSFSVASEKMALATGIDFFEPIPKHEQILSPSDTGFHNTLREPGETGRILFLDFEYFGWDDPGKMIVDFLLHPGMNLTPEHKKQFVDTMLGSLMKTRPLLGVRLPLLYRLIGLQWIMILLNEFVDSDMERRKFAMYGNGAKQWKDECEILFHQLERADKLLESLYEENNETIDMLSL